MTFLHLEQFCDVPYTVIGTERDQSACECLFPTQCLASLILGTSVTFRFAFDNSWILTSHPVFVASGKYWQQKKSNEYRWSRNRYNTKNNVNSCGFSREPMFRQDKIVKELKCQRKTIKWFGPHGVFQKRWESKFATLKILSHWMSRRGFKKYLQNDPSSNAPTRTSLWV